MVIDYADQTFIQIYQQEKEEGNISFGKPPENYLPDDRKLVRWTKGEDLVIPEQNVYY